MEGDLVVSPFEPRFCPRAGFDLRVAEGGAAQALDDLQKEFDEAKKQLTVLKEGLNEETKAETIRGTVVWLRNLHHLVQGSTLIQARARLEAISVETIHLDSETAVKVALANRIDWMNGRASLVDSWRLSDLAVSSLPFVFEHLHQ